MIKREIVVLLTPSSTPTPVADRKVMLSSIPKLYNFTSGGQVEGYATEGLDADSEST